MAPLRMAIDEYLFVLDYPNALVRGITEITEFRLANLFRDLTVTWDTPCLVRDQIIYGEVFSLITLESDWCRGYMMVQTDEQPLLDLLGRKQRGDGTADFRDLNSMLGELTNLIWGAFKDRYLGNAQAARSQVQVPLVVNHKQRYISFGTTNPQLCFKYNVIDEATGRSVVFDQRFIFNLSWSPEDFKEGADDVDALVAAGELDLF
jgi:CheY-specific phosphatase CheX